ncbi:hypothetical protein AX14_005256 [Amanita brunnescens Koide BX004]|nr:hypothetical protein AX14_005256 [Amanita brunnescens Koide BX004]
MVEIPTEAFGLSEAYVLDPADELAFFKPKLCKGEFPPFMRNHALGFEVLCHFPEWNDLWDGGRVSVEVGIKLVGAKTRLFGYCSETLSQFSMVRGAL